MESLCDQRVLEELEGEERRAYGKILLSMTDEKYARAPGTTSISNGGKNIKRRIEAIARFKKYPRGMALVSVCALVVLAAPIFAGSETSGYGTDYPNLSDYRSKVMMAEARMNGCTCLLYTSQIRMIASAALHAVSYVQTQQLRFIGRFRKWQEYL